MQKEIVAIYRKEQIRMFLEFPEQPDEEKQRELVSRLKELLFENVEREEAFYDYCNGK